jgi:hypothetical protein
MPVLPVIVKMDMSIDDFSLTICVHRGSYLP